MAFYNDGDVLMEVDEQQLLRCWKKFFSTERSDAVFREVSHMSDKKNSYREKLEQMSGLPAVAVKEWPNDTNVTRYAREYCAIALPSQTAPRLLETSKRFCEHVYKTIKKGKLDDGWTCLK